MMNNIPYSQEELLSYLGFKDNSPNAYIKRNITNDGFDCLSAGQAGISSSINGLNIKCISDDEITIDKGYCLDDTYYLNMYNSKLEKLKIPVDKDCTYHIFMIAQLDGKFKFYYSTELSPKLPMGYFYKRRIWSIIIQDNKIKSFIQIGNKCHFLSPTKDFSGYLPIGVSQIKLPIPDGLKPEIELVHFVDNIYNNYNLSVQSSITNFKYKVIDNFKICLLSTNEVIYDLIMDTDKLYNDNLFINVFTMGYNDAR